MLWVRFALDKRGLDEGEALVEREPSRPGMPVEHDKLLDRRVETVPECRVATHRNKCGAGH